MAVVGESERGREKGRRRGDEEFEGGGRRGEVTGVWGSETVGFF